MRKLLLTFLLLFLLGVGFAHAGTGTYTPVISGTFTDYSNATIGAVTPVQVIAANNARKYLVIQNVSANDIGCSYASTPVIGGVGTITLDAYSSSSHAGAGSWTFDGNFIYSGAVYCIASGGSNNTVTVLEGN